jgi:hypothetical protein
MLRCFDYAKERRGKREERKEATREEWGEERAECR